MFKIIELRDYNIKTKLGIKLAYVAYLELVSNARQDFVTHNITEIMSVKCGKGVFNVDGVLHEVEKNDLFIVNADSLHREESLSSNFGVYIIGIENYSLEGNETESPKPYKGDTDRVSYYCEQIIKDYEKKSKDFYENAIMLFSLIINEVLDSARKKPVPNVKRGSNELVNMVKKYIDEHYLEDITIPFLAEKFFINKNTLMHSFKRHNDCSIIDYVLKKRLKESENWLKISSMAISQIALRCNFANASYFIKYFKKVYGLTPVEYRKKNQND